MGLLKSSWWPLKTNFSLFHPRTQVDITITRKAQRLFAPTDQLRYPPYNHHHHFYIEICWLLIYKLFDFMRSSLTAYRLLNKACIINKSPQEDLITAGFISEPVSTCTVEKVEELKTLIKVIPLWSTGIMMAVSVNQNSFLLLQANSMNNISPQENTLL